MRSWWKGESPAILFNKIILPPSSTSPSSISTNTKQKFISRRKPTISSRPPFGLFRPILALRIGFRRPRRKRRKLKNRRRKIWRKYPRSQPSRLRKLKINRKCKKLRKRRKLTTKMIRSWKRWSKMKDPRRERKIRRRKSRKNSQASPKLFKGTNPKQVCSTKKSKNQNQ